MIARLYNQIMTAFCHDLDSMVVRCTPGLHPMPDPACSQVKNWLATLADASKPLRAVDAAVLERSRAIDRRVDSICAKYAMFNEPDNIPRLRACLHGLKRTAKDKLGRSLRKRQHQLASNQQSAAIRQSLIDATGAFLAHPDVEGLFPSLRGTIKLWQDLQRRPAA